MVVGKPRGVTQCDKAIPRTGVICHTSIWCVLTLHTKYLLMKSVTQQRYWHFTYAAQSVICYIFRLPQIKKYGNYFKVKYKMASLGLGQWKASKHPRHQWDYMNEKIKHSMIFEMGSLIAWQAFALLGKVLIMNSGWLIEPKPVLIRAMC